MLGEPIAVALIVVDAFESLGIRYLVGGSFASSLHGEPRTTMDIDLVAELHMSDVDEFVRALAGTFYCDAEAIRDAVRNESCFNVLHLASPLKVDVFVAGQNAFARTQMDRRALFSVLASPERAAYVASAEDTIMAKLRWYRLGGEISDRQWGDVLGVLRIQGDRLDDDYLRRWAAQLGIADLLERALSEARRS